MIDKSINRLLFGSKISEEEKGDFEIVFPEILRRSERISMISTNGGNPPLKRPYKQYKVLMGSELRDCVGRIGEAVDRGGLQLEPGPQTWIKALRSSILRAYGDLEILGIPFTLPNLRRFSETLKAGKVDHEALEYLRREIS